MKLQVRGSNVDVTEVLRAHVTRRLRFALGRFEDRIGRVLVRFTDVNGERGGADKRCRIEVALRPRTVRVDDTDADLFVAVDHAAGRVSRSVARALERERDAFERPLRWASR